MYQCPLGALGAGEEEKNKTKLARLRWLRRDTFVNENGPLWWASLYFSYI